MFNFFKPKIKTTTLDIIFRISFLTFLVLFAVEVIIPGFVANYFDPAWFLIIAIFSGILNRTHI